MSAWFVARNCTTETPRPRSGALGTGTSDGPLKIWTRRALGAANGKFGFPGPGTANPHPVPQRQLVRGSRVVGSGRFRDGNINVER
ncbi:hypothetical protein GCM10009848_21430 [Micromonospora lupini]